MKRYCMPVLLISSVLLNIGVIGAVLVLETGIFHSDSETQHGHTFLATYLQLDNEQLPRWRSNEQMFLDELNTSWNSITEHRELMIHEIFSDNPDPAMIENERQAITALQTRQQQIVIRQLMKEREILTESQRKMLADLLINNYPFGSLEQMLFEEIDHN